MRKFYLAITRRIVLDCLFSFLKDGNYELVLKHLPKPFSLKGKDEAYCNLFRILALRDSRDDKWRQEWEFFNDQNMLEVFEPNDQRCIRNFLRRNLEDIFEIDLDLDPAAVSPRTKKYFGS